MTTVLDAVEGLKARLFLALRGRSILVVGRETRTDPRVLRAWINGASVHLKVLERLEAWVAQEEAAQTRRMCAADLADTLPLP